MSPREAELRERLQAVQDRVDATCAEAGRDPAEVTLVVVTKTYPAADVLALAAAGVADVGENRHPEAGDKAAEVAAAGADVRWHFLGHLQTNKAGAVARYADLVQSVDRSKLARSLSRGAEAAGREIGCLVQVDVDGTDDGRSGAAVADVPALADLVAELPGLRLDGLMVVAPLGADPRPAFEQVAELAARVREDHPGSTVLSAGMSGDFEVALHCGATHLRVGRAILGERPSVG